MDRQIVYIGANPLDTDTLNQNKNTMVGLGMALQAVLGSSLLFSGLSCTPTGPASLQVLVGPGSVYSFQNVDNTAYGSLSSDTTHQIVKQGISLGTVTLTCPAPGTTGQSINYLIQSAYQDADTGATVLPYYNSSNPGVAYNGPGNSGTSQNTVRQGQCVVSVLAGVAATTGSQATPAPTAGYSGLYVVTVANGQTTITSGNIALYSGAPFISETLTQKISIATGDARYLQITNSRMKLTANLTLYVSTTGNDTTGVGTSGNPWATVQRALNYIAQSIDLAGYVVTIQLADGTYSSTFSLSQTIVGNSGYSSIIINGNSTTPSNVVISTSSNCASSNNGGAFTIQNMKLTSSGGNGLFVGSNGQIAVGVGIVFGSCSGVHIAAGQPGAQTIINGSYTISGGASAHLNANATGAWIAYGSSVTVTLSGTPAFTSSFAAAANSGEVFATTVTFSGSATGSRYSASANGVINTNGGGASFFPGNSSGSTATGGQYI